MAGGAGVSRVGSVGFERSVCVARWHRGLTGFVIVVVGLLVLAPAASADICYIVTTGSSCGPTGSGTTDSTFDASGALFYQMTQQPVGTGVIDPFLRLQNTGTEQGYNTSDLDFQFDQKMPLNYTHDLQLSDVPIVTINGTEYRQFLLDINESNSANGRYVSLDQLQIFLLPDGMADEYNTTTRTLEGSTAIYDMDSGADNWIKMNYQLNGGSGNGDMIVYIPNSLFTGPTNQYLYLYSKFGSNFVADGPSDAGFEEWWVDKSLLRNPPPPPDTVPEPTGMALLGLGVAAAAYRRVRNRRH